ncbi:SusD/RagB family nutrient-binding outer membrane lipoprotein [Flavobacterium sp. WC2416]|uniref:SusD/RagB family nutrient-binding outer membrane lipoprotein n=1 Tax=Flavobacterium sp. WC2416 TaxID=3234141 RepID=A0AB39WEK7_9FLAO
MKKIILFILLLSVSISCNDGFEEINTNKNQPTVSQPKQLLPNVIFNLANNNVSNSFNFGDIVAQYGGNYEYNELDIYNWGADNRFWGMYKWLNDIYDIKKQAILLNNKNYEAISLVLETYTMSLITDSYGYAPYSEASKGEEGILKPKYDSQEEIYTQLLLNLDKANTLIDTKTKVEGDLLYGGDMLKWKKFCNSLHVRLLMRISNKINVSVKLNDIVSKPAEFPLFQSNADNANYVYSGSFPNISPMSDGINRLYGYNIVIPSTNLVNTLITNNDPRLEEWIDPIVGTTNQLGLQPGLTLDQIGEPTKYSRRAEDYFYNKTKISSIFMTYSELNFLLAEANQRNLITSGSAKTYYDTAVEASFKQWNVIMPTDYLTTTAPYSATSEVLYTQKWLALYHTGVEAWLDWKRTGKPSFIKAGPGSKNNGKVPRRIMYPSLEQSVNAENNSEALQKMGSDDINVKVWWDNF